MIESNKTNLLNVCHFLIASIGVVIIFVSLSVYFGTLHKITVLTSIFPDWINMKMNTAACFLIAGFALLIMSKQNHHDINDIALTIFACIILLVSSMTIFEYIAGIDLGIDQLLAKDILPQAPGTISPGRMSFVTAINFTLLGFTFLFSLRKSISIWITQTCVYLILMISLITIFNYLYKADTGYFYVKFTTMSVQASLLFILASLGILLKNPSAGVVGILLKDNSSGYLLRRVILIPVILPILGFFLQIFLVKEKIIDTFGSMALTQVEIFGIIGILMVLTAIVLDKKEKILADAQKEIDYNANIFQQFTENTDTVFFIASNDLGKMLYISPAYEKIWGKSTESLYKNPKDWLESILADDKNTAYEILFLGLQHGNQSGSTEYRIQRPDGSIRNIYARCFIFQDKNSNTSSIIGTAVDITNNKTDQLYQQLNLDLSRLVETEKTIHEFIPKCLKMFCLALDWNIGELWLIDDSKNIMRCADIWHKNIEALANFAKKSHAHTFTIGEGLPGRVWKEKQPAWIENYSSTHAFSRSAEAKQAGLNSALAFPILYQDQIFGVLEFFNPKIFKPDAALLSLLENFGKNIGAFLTHTHNLQQIQNMSHQDFLTGLLNRAALEESLSKIIADQKSKSIAVMALDIDRFKKINEAFGHEIGDILLKQITSRLKEPLDHKKIILARLGADKFILYIPDINQADAQNYAYALCRRINEPFSIEGDDIIITASVGIAMYPQNALDSKTLVTFADLATLQGKNQRGNCINFFTAEMSSIAAKEMSMDIDLRQAITSNQFVLAYQPQVNLKTGKICAVEALVRWQHPINGLIPPNAFISFAEKIGLIVSLNEQIIRMVFQQLSLNRSGPPVSINISVKQLQNGFHIVDYLESLMKEFTIDSNKIELEITENMLLENSEHNIAVLIALRQLGFQISIDDFGSGFSSFGYLNRLPVNKIKIDRVFIAGLPKTLANAKIVRAIISMAHSLDKIVVAEGAETQAEIDFLMQENCDIVQGYYYYKPMSFEKLAALMAKQH